jgi:hypothetical protein
MEVGARESKVQFDLEDYVEAFSVYVVQQL